VLLDNDLTSIVEAVRLGRATYNNLRKFVSYIYTQNWAELLAFIVFVILRTPLPLLGIQELAIDLFLGVVPSLALIMEPPEADVMTKLPHSSGERLISVVMLTKSGIIGMVVGTGTILVAFSIWAKGEWFLGASTIIDPKIYAMGTTVVVTGIVAGQLGNLFATKDQL
jgi:sodium/potassium-transporting ATPase subunit alpha